MGDRTLNMEDAFVFEDMTHGYKAVVVYNPIMKSGGIFKSHTYAGKTDEMRGLIYYPDKNVTPSEKYKKFKDINDVKKEICTIEGSWLKNCIIDGEEMWDIKHPDQRPMR